MRKWAAPAALLAVFFFRSFLASRVESATVDEPAHLAAGLSYVSTGVFHANPQHPVLMKELSGLSMRAAGIRWLHTAAADDIVSRYAGVATGRDWVAGEEILATYGAERVLAAARFPLILVGVLLGVFLYLWAREMLGPAAGIGALLLFALDPTLAGHSALVTTDIGLAAFGTAFLYALWKYRQDPGGGRLVACGVALGCALGAKYSAVLLIPIAAVLLLWDAVQKTPLRIDWGRAGRAAGAVAAILAIAVGMIELFYGFRASPLTYWNGVRLVNADHNTDYLFYLAGTTAHRFPQYFAVAYLLKEPLASVLLCLAGCVLLVRQKWSGSAPRFVLVPAAVLFAVYSMGAANLGIRYIIPVIALLLLAGGAAFGWLVNQRVLWARVAAVTLTVWLVIAAVGIYPDHLSYFNEAACAFSDPSRIGFDGGSRCGPRWLDDHNVDWGQAMGQLKQWLDLNAQGRPVHILGYMGAIKPEFYGIAHTPRPAQPTGRPELYVISANHLARMSLTDPTFLKIQPLAIIGHAMYIYQ